MEVSPPGSESGRETARRSVQACIMEHLLFGECHVSYFSALVLEMWPAVTCTSPLCPPPHTHTSKRKSIVQCREHSFVQRCIWVGILA